VRTAHFVLSIPTMEAEIRLDQKDRKTEKTKAILKKAAIN
jgi:hypothetical protein